ncbi:MAG: tetratricopeptide repeat protein [Paludibacteraceae bacterium]|nr:tetratricopeptide repeat protein [Paludibacteraceae bacterium]
MKKVFLPVVLLCLATTMFAQKGNISKAKTKAYNVEAPDPQGAKTLIEEALVHPETANQAKTWFEAGAIFNKIQQDETDKQRMGLPCDINLRQECLLKVLPCFLKADSMDQLPDAKGKIKPKYTKKIKNELLNLYRNYSIELSANEAFNNKDYESAANIFDVYINIPLMSALASENLLVTDTNYTFYKYNAGIAHYQAGTPEHIAKAIQYFQELTESTYSDQNSVYQILLSLYLNSANDTANYVRNLVDAVQKFPTENYYIEQLVDYYVQKKENEKAIVYLEQAISNNPSNEHNYFLLGRVKEEMGDFDAAEALYDKTIEMKPDHVYAYTFKGNIIYNKAVDIDNKANEIKDNKEYQKAKAEANAMLEKSLPFYEKALELKPDDYENIRWLRSIYYRLDKKEKFNEMEQRLKALGF